MPSLSSDSSRPQGLLAKLRHHGARLCARVANLPARRALRAALAIWIIFGVVVSVVVAVDPDGHSATKEYRKASTNWWAQNKIYQKKNGYLYLPQEAMLYTPYNVLPVRVGEPFWRLTMLALLAWSMWQAARWLAPRHREQLFLAATVLVIPSALASAQNGQVNMALAGIYLLTASALADRRWIFAAFLLVISLALKPISVVPILLCGALYAPLRIPLAVGLVALFGSAYLHPSPAYVQSQYELFITTLLKAGKPTGNTWCDYAGIFRTLDIPIADKLNTLIRAVAALVTLGLCWWVTRGRDAIRGAFTMMLLAVIYLMLFNPRTETNSYVMLGTFAAVWAAYEIAVRRGSILAACLFGFAIILGTECYGRTILNATDHWLKAVLTIAFGIWLVAKIVNTPKGDSVILLPEKS